jgi:hypothetical protein
MKYSLQDILSGNVLGHSLFKDQYKLIVLISSLIILYIYSGYQSQRQQRELGELQTVLQDVQMTKMTVNAQLMEKTRQSSIVSLLQHKGSDLKESKTPAIRIQ